MLVYDNSNHQFIIDPHYLTIAPLKEIWKRDKSANKEIASALLMWLYHMYNPHSPFRDYREQIKSIEIVRAVFPKEYVNSKMKALEEAITKVKDNELAVQIANTAKEEFNSGAYDPSIEPGMDKAITWYKAHLRQTPLWTAYESYKDAIYNLSKIIRNPDSTAQQIRTASQELDVLPGKMDKMRQQAERDEAMTLKVAGDKHIKRGERLPHEIKAKSKAVS